MSTEKEIVMELVRLRRGWGIKESDLRQRLGPHLIRLCGIEPGHRQRDVHNQVHGWLARMCEELPPDLARATKIGFGLDRAHQHSKFTTRVEDLASAQSVATRTARRRVDHAVREIAEAAARFLEPSEEVTPETGWHVRRIRSVLRLDKDGPELHETRVVVAERANLDEIALRLSAVAPAGQTSGRRAIEADIVQGARLTEAQVLHDSQHFRWLLALWPPLQLGDEREIQIIYRVPHGRLARPRYTLIPAVPCESFELLARFGAVPPADIWRLDGAPPTLLDDIGDDDPLTPDANGDVRLAFTGLRPGWAYGLKWRA